MTSKKSSHSDIFYKSTFPYNKFLSITLLSIFNLLLFSCSKVEKENCVHLNLSGSKTVDVAEKVCIDAAIPLKDGENPFMLGLEDIIKIGDKFVAHDKTGVIYIFDVEGNLISSSEAVIGPGPGEYDNMLAYSYNSFNNTVEVITPIKMMVYDLSFRFVEDRPIPSRLPKSGKDGCMISEIYDLSEDIHIMLPSSTSYNRNTIIIYNSKEDRIIKTIDYGSNIVSLVNMQAHSFTDIGDTLLFYPPGIGKYAYSFDKKDFSLTKEIAIEGLDFDFFKNQEEHNMNYVLNSPKLMPLRFLYTDQKIVFLAKEGNNINSISYMVSNDDGSMDKFMIRNGKQPSFPLLTFSDGKSIYGLCEVDDLRGYYTAMGSECPDSLNVYPTTILRFGLKK